MRLEANDPFGLRVALLDVLGCNVVLQVYQTGNISIDDIGVKKLDGQKTNMKK